MQKVVKPFVSENLPEFVVSDNPNFTAFIEAYYEYLEKRNDLLSTNLDLDYIDYLYRQKFKFGKENEKIIKIKFNFRFIKLNRKRNKSRKCS